MEDLSQYNADGTTLRKAQLRMLEMLVVIDKICRKNNIPYWIDAGTLLGAARHKGFIPWDDDVDVSVMRKDYNRFFRVLEKELPEQYTLVDSSLDKNYFFAYFRVVDKKSKVVSKHMQMRERKYKGLFVDVFPRERGYSKIKIMVDYVYGRVFRRLHNMNDSKAEYFVSCLLWPICMVAIAVLRLFYFLTQTDAIIYGYAINGLPGFNSQERYQDVFPLGEIEFEGHMFQCPGNYHSYLTTKYGNYMQIPPENKREIHSIEMELFD